LVVAGGHDGVEALYTTEELQVEGDGSFASEWCAPSRSVARTHARTHSRTEADVLHRPVTQG
jgi:hypothetical protein